MRKFILLLLLFFSCAPEYYTPQSMFKEDPNPNKHRTEGNYSHELNSIKALDAYIPQTIKKEEIKKEITEEYVPQTQRKSLIFPPVDPRFIGTWTGYDPNNSELLMVTTLSSNNTATYYEINSGVKSVPVTFKWFHQNDKWGYFIDLSQYNYVYDNSLENTETFYAELLNDFGVKYEWVNNRKLKLFTEEGTVFFNKEDENKLHKSNSNYVSQTIESTYEYTPQTKAQPNNELYNHLSKQKTHSYAPQTIQ